MLATDIHRVVEIHLESFPASRSSKLGGPFLKKMYKWYFLYHPMLSFVATLDDRVVGFVTGSIGGGSAQRRFRYAFWQIVWGFLRQPRLFFQPEMFEAWNVHVASLFFYIRNLFFRQQPRPNSSTVRQELRIKATLDSIAVSSSARGRNIGEFLVSAFEQAARNQGATYMGLGVERDNLAARRLYERCGWQIVFDNVERNSANYIKNMS